MPFDGQVARQDAHGLMRCTAKHASMPRFVFYGATVIRAVYTLGTGAVAQAALGKKDASPKAELLLGTEDKVPAPSGRGFNLVE